MILDRGTCTIYRKTSTTPAGGKPTWTLAAIHEGYYGELAFETSPARPTDGREETETATRIRILQNRNIRNQDLAELAPFDGSSAKTEKYRIKRAYHGSDDDSGEPITDLTLEIAETWPTKAASTGGSGGSGNAETGTTGDDPNSGSGGSGNAEAGTTGDDPNSGNQESGDELPGEGGQEADEG